VLDYDKINLLKCLYYLSATHDDEAIIKIRT